MTIFDNENNRIIKPFRFIKREQFKLQEASPPKRAPATVWPLIPTRYIFTGDKIKAHSMIGLGKKRFNDLRTMLSPQGLETGFNTLELEDGSTIKTSQSYGISTIAIYVPVVGGEEIITEEGKECLCFPCFVQATILEVYINVDGDKHIVGPDDGDEETGFPATDEELEIWHFIYDISICTETSYIILENYHVKSEGWAEYSKGQNVLVTIDKAFETNDVPDCCINEICLAKDLLNTDKTFDHALLISPLYIKGLEEWQQK